MNAALHFIGAISLLANPTNQLQVDGAVLINLGITADRHEHRELRVVALSSGKSDVYLRDLTTENGQRILPGTNTYRFRLIWGATCEPGKCKFKPIVNIRIYYGERSCYSLHLEADNRRFLSGGIHDIGSTRVLCK
jgi:hypothetical protein